jgi:hypothetical protein
MTADFFILGQAVGGCDMACASITHLEFVDVETLRVGAIAQYLHNPDFLQSSARGAPWRFLAIVSWPINRY